MGDIVANPILPGFYPDPSICAFEDRFLLVTSSFEYFPAIPIFESYDLVSWRQIGHCLIDPRQTDLGDSLSSQGFFAPTIRSRDGVLYLVVTNVTRAGHQLFSATSPEGPWEGPITIDQHGIDPSLFFDADGTVYFQSNVEPDPSGEHALAPSFQRGIQQSVIDVRDGRILDGPRLLWEGSGGRFPEAPHLYRRGDFYYLLVAEGGTERGHMATVARSRSVWGPFEPHPRNPVLTHRSLPLAVQSVGHADLIELRNGEWWAVCLGNRPVEHWHHLGRETFLLPVTWDVDQWPQFGDGGTIPLGFARPALAPHALPAEADVDAFDGDILDLPWNTLRRPLGDRLHVGDGVRLSGGPADLTDLDVSFVGRRLRYFDAEAEVDFAVSGAGEGGVVVRLDEHHFVALALRTGAQGPTLVVRTRIGGIESESSLGHDDTSARVRIVFTAERCEFFLQDDTGTRSVAGHDLRYLSSEVAGGFTGAYVGLYCVGDEAQLTCDRFAYRPLEPHE